MKKVVFIGVVILVLAFAGVNFFVPQGKEKDAGTTNFQDTS